MTCRFPRPYAPAIGASSSFTLPPVSFGTGGFFVSSLVILIGQL